MRGLKALLDLCTSHGTRVILFVSPSHADEMEILHLTGAWPAFEQWKRDLVALAAMYHEGAAPVTVWDFSGYNVYTSESVLQNPRRMHWYLDTGHYTHALGVRAHRTHTRQRRE